MLPCKWHGLLRTILLLFLVGTFAITVAGLPIGFGLRRANEMGIDHRSSDGQASANPKSDLATLWRHSANVTADGVEGSWWVLDVRRDLLTYFLGSRKQ